MSPIPPVGQLSYAADAFHSMTCMRAWLPWKSLVESFSKFCCVVLVPILLRRSRACFDKWKSSGGGDYTTSTKYVVFVCDTTRHTGAAASSLFVVVVMTLSFWSCFSSQKVPLFITLFYQSFFIFSQMYMITSFVVTFFFFRVFFLSPKENKVSCFDRNFFWGIRYSTKVCLSCLLLVVVLFVVYFSTTLSLAVCTFLHC